MPNPPNAGTIDLAPKTLDLLRHASTATVAMLLFKRGYQNAYIQGVQPLAAGTPTMAGPAYTLRYIPTRPDSDPLDAFREADHPQRVAVESRPPGAVLVMDAARTARPRLRGRSC